MNYGASPIYLPNDSDKTLSKGCQCCKSGSWWCLYVGHKCNLECYYCPQGNDKYKNTLVDDKNAMQRLWIDDIKRSLQMVEPGTIKGVSYSGGEPMMYLDKIVDMASFISKNFPDIYQWAYTNGLIATPENLQILKDNGLQEIRFHIGATNFSSKVMEHLKQARNIFDLVTVETPGMPNLKHWAITDKGLDLLVDYGIQQINVSELYLSNGITHPGFENESLYNYTSMARGSHISPTNSRMVTYDILDYCIENKLDIVVNDCSHEARDAQLITRELNKNRLKEMY